MKARQLCNGNVFQIAVSLMLLTLITGCEPPKTPIVTKSAGIAKKVNLDDSGKSEPSESETETKTEAKIEPIAKTQAASAAPIVGPGRPQPAIATDAPPESTYTKTKRAPIYIEEPNGKELIAAALKKAKRDHKNVLVEWGGNWCGWC